MSVMIATGRAATQGMLFRDAGASVTHLAVDGRLAGLLAVTDPIQVTTADSIHTLHASGLRIGPPGTA